MVLFQSGEKVPPTAPINSPVVGPTEANGGPPVAGLDTNDDVANTSSLESDSEQQQLLIHR